MLSVPTFHYDDIVLRAGNSKKATGILHVMKTEGLIMPVRRGMYVALNNGSPVSNYFQIASHINNGCCISHHTAFDINGGNKVRRLYTGNGFFTFNLDKDWNLYIPNNINTLLENGGDEIS